MTNGFGITDQAGHNTKEAGRPKVDIGAPGEELHGGQS